MKKLFNILIICSILVVFLLSCKKESTKVSGIIVEPKNLILSAGDVVDLVYLVMPYKADNKSISFKSKDVSVATVSDKGIITAISEGETQIVVTTNEGNVNDEVFVRVLRGSTELDSITLLNLHKEGCIKNSESWNLTKPMHTWNGVGLNAKRRVLSFGTLVLQKTLDESLANLAFLQTLSIYGNSDSYYDSNDIIPKEIGMLYELHTLSIYYFYGKIPAEIGNLSKLKNLSIFSSQLEGIPVELGNLNNLKKLDFNWNFIIGNIPKELGKLEELELLTMYDCYLTGSIPKELGNLSNLKVLELRYNQITGNIPIELSKLSKLEVLRLNSNSLSGEIPPELGNLHNLSELNVRYNSLSGNIPQSLLDKFDKWSFCPQYGTNFENLDCNWW